MQPRMLALMTTLLATSSGARGEPLVPPLDPGDPLLRELGNPLRKAMVVARATTDNIARVDGAFLAGSWRAFEAWVAFVEAGKIATTTAAAPATPHATYWAGVLARPAAERDAFLRFVVAGRRLHAGVRDKLRRPTQLPACDATCQQLLVGYLAAFATPAHAVDETKSLGPTVDAYTHYPDAATVGLAGDLGLAAAVPHLVRFVGARRRFHQIFTDYSTRPEEVGDAFRTSVRALVMLARSDAKLAPAIRTALEAERTRPDKVWFETDSDGGGRPGAAHNAVREADATTLTGKLATLDEAIRAIAGDAGAVASLGERIPLYPHARWIDRFDPTSALEGRGGRVWLDDRATRLVHLDQHGATGIDLATGDHLYDLHWEGSNTAGSIQGWGSTFAVTHAGLVAPIGIRPTTVKGDEIVTLFTIDPQTGAIVAPPVALPKDRPAPYGPDGLAPTAGDALWYRNGTSAWKLAPDGKQLATRTLTNDDRLAVSADKLARYTIAHIAIETADGKPVLDRTFAELAAAAGVTGPAPVGRVVLRRDHFVAFGRNQALLAFDYTGKALWQVELDEQWRDAGPVDCGGDRLCVHTGTAVHVIAADGRQLAKLPLARPVEAVLASADTAYLLVDGAILAQPFSGGKPRTIVDGLGSTRHLVGLTDTCVLVTFYVSGQRVGDPSGMFLGCFPR